MNRTLALFAVVLTLVGAVLPARRAAAQLPDSLSDQARISLVTVLPGEQLYSLFGHSAFRVVDPVTGVDELFNYGTFEFGDPLAFALRFMRGQLDYMLSTEPYPRAAYIYEAYEDRSFIQQWLNLSPDQAESVYQFLKTNAQPENRTYRYDFLFDNCSTRLRAVLEQTLGTVRFRPEPDPNLSFRRLLDPYVADRPFLDLGFDLLLGIPTDRIATPKEADFLPLNLLASFEAATVVHEGVVRPLVARTDTVYWNGEPALPAPSPPWPLFLLSACLVAGVVLTAAEVRSGRHTGRVFDGLLFGVVGVMGTLMFVMWFFTEHRVTAANLNVLWAWPTHAVAAVALLRSPGAYWLRPYLAAAAVTCLIVAGGWALWPQNLHEALLPLVLLLALRSGAQAFRLREKHVAYTGSERPV